MLETELLHVSTGLSGGEDGQAVPVPGWFDGHVNKRRGHDSWTCAPGKDFSPVFLYGLQTREYKPPFKVNVLHFHLKEVQKTFVLRMESSKWPQLKPSLVTAVPEDVAVFGL